MLRLPTRRHGWHARGHLALLEGDTIHVAYVSPLCLSRYLKARRLSTTHYPPFTIHYSLLTIHHSLLTTHYLLLTTHYSLPEGEAALATCGARRPSGLCSLPPHSSMSRGPSWWCRSSLARPPGADSPGAWLRCTRDEPPNRTGPYGRLRCGLEARLKSPIAPLPPSYSRLLTSYYRLLTTYYVRITRCGARRALLLAAAGAVGTPAQVRREVSRSLTTNTTYDYYSLPTQWSYDYYSLLLTTQWSRSLTTTSSYYYYYSLTTTSYY